MRIFLLAGVVLSAAPVAAAAADLPMPNEVCGPDHVVDPVRLVARYINPDKVDLAALNRQINAAPAGAGAVDPARLLADSSLCTDSDGSACTAYNKAQIQLFAAIDNMTGKAGAAQYSVVGGTRINERAFALGEGPQIACAPSGASPATITQTAVAGGDAKSEKPAAAHVAEGKPAAAAVAATAGKSDAGYHFPLLVRGSPDGMDLDDDDARKSPEFKSLPKATVSSSWDGSTGKTQNKSVLFLGKTIYNPDDTFTDKNGDVTTYPVARAVLYAGVNKSVSIDKSKAKTTSTNITEFGLSYSASYYDKAPSDRDCTGDPDACAVVSWVTIRPDYLIDYANKDRLASLNLVWTPYLDGSVNSYRSLIKDVVFARYAWTFELHQDNGWYVRRGPSGLRDFNRIGLKPGVVIVSQFPDVPLTFTLNDTIMYGFRGTPKHFDDTYADLSWALDPNKYFAIELTYTNGRKELTGALDRTWNVGLTAKY